MRSSVGQHLLRLLGILCAVAGFLMWIHVGWRGFTDLEGMTAKGDVGTRLMTWGLTGTVLMITGMVILHLADDEPEPEEQDGPTPPG